jgi:hypothetical protein
MNLGRQQGEAREASAPPLGSKIIKRKEETIPNIRKLF